MRSKRILIVDDEPMVREFLKEALDRKQFNVQLASGGHEALNLSKKNKYDLILSDLLLPDISGLEILKEIKKEKNGPGMIMITGHGSVKTAVEAIKIGAFDYIAKPISSDALELVVERFFDYQKLIEENMYLRSESNRDYDFTKIVGESPKMLDVFGAVKAVAQSKASVLIQGESGTGKELIARAIHYNSDRKDAPFVKTNCAALPEGLIESELFGHQKGAFTGALRNAKGRFEIADGGTLLLDEISEMNPSLQAKLLRVLQEEEFERVGSSETVQIDVRIISTTNKDLLEQIKKDYFREDLYYRLNVVPIILPSLRERKEDIPPLIQHFVEKYNAKNNKMIKGIAPDALKLLQEYDWPGNVRELENTVQRAVVISTGDVLHQKHFPFLEKSDSRDCSEVVVNITLDEIERDAILERLRLLNGNRKETAKLLGISERTLRNKLGRYKKEGYWNDRSHFN